jgi:hypothetical protein
MSEIAQASVRQQLQVLKETTRLTGGLHEAQVLNLKMWPLILFTNVCGSSFSWDPDKKTVSFVLVLEPKAKKKKQAWWEKRVNILNEWVHELLGSEWIVEVSDGKITTLRGKREIRGTTKPLRTLFATLPTALTTVILCGWIRRMRPKAATRN